MTALLQRPGNLTKDSQPPLQMGQVVLVQPTLAPLPAMDIRPRLETTNSQLSRLLLRLLKHELVDLELSLRSGRRWRKISRKTWNAAPSEIWRHIFDARASVKLFFRHLRECLAPSDYRAALIAARRELSGFRARAEAEDSI